jgi:hypothetical protein
MSLFSVYYYPESRDMCQAVSLLPLIGETHFQSQGNPCGICADKVTLGQVFFFLVLESSAVSFVPPMLRAQFINHRK